MIHWRTQGGHQPSSEDFWIQAVHLAEQLASRPCGNDIYVVINTLCLLWLFVFGAVAAVYIAFGEMMEAQQIFAEVTGQRDADEVTERRMMPEAPALVV